MTSAMPLPTLLLTVQTSAINSIIVTNNRAAISGPLSLDNF